MTRVKNNRTKKFVQTNLGNADKGEGNNSIVQSSNSKSINPIHRYPPLF